LSIAAGFWIGLHSEGACSEFGRIPACGGDRAIRSNKNACAFLFRFYPLRGCRHVYKNRFWNFTVGILPQSRISQKSIRSK
jgi:hypothetical protein